MITCCGPCRKAELGKHVVVITEETATTSLLSLVMPERLSITGRTLGTSSIPGIPF